MVWSSAGVEIAEIVVKIVTSHIKMVLQIHVFGSECKAHGTAIPILHCWDDAHDLGLS